MRFTSTKTVAIKNMLDLADFFKELSDLLVEHPRDISIDIVYKITTKNKHNMLKTDKNRRQ